MANLDAREFANLLSEKHAGSAPDDDEYTLEMKFNFAGEELFAFVSRLNMGQRGPGNVNGDVEFGAAVRRFIDAAWRRPGAGAGAGAGDEDEDDEEGDQGWRDDGGSVVRNFLPGWCMAAAAEVAVAAIRSRHAPYKHPQKRHVRVRAHVDAGHEGIVPVAVATQPRNFGDVAGPGAVVTPAAVSPLYLGTPVGFAMLCANWNPPGHDHLVRVLEHAAAVATAAKDLADNPDKRADALLWQAMATSAKSAVDEWVALLGAVVPGAAAAAAADEAAIRAVPNSYAVFVEYAAQAARDTAHARASTDPAHAAGNTNLVDRYYGIPRAQPDALPPYMPVYVLAAADVVNGANREWVFLLIATQSADAAVVGNRLLECAKYASEGAVRCMRFVANALRQWIPAQGPYDAGAYLPFRQLIEKAWAVSEHVADIVSATVRQPPAPAAWDWTLLPPPAGAPQPADPLPGLAEPLRAAEDAHEEEGGYFYGDVGGDLPARLTPLLGDMATTAAAETDALRKPWGFLANAFIDSALAAFGAGHSRAAVTELFYTMAEGTVRACTGGRTHGPAFVQAARLILAFHGEARRQDRAATPGAYRDADPDLLIAADEAPWLQILPGGVDGAKSVVLVCPWPLIPPTSGAPNPGQGEHVNNVWHTLRAVTPHAYLDPVGANRLATLAGLAAVPTCRDWADTVVGWVDGLHAAFERELARQKQKSQGAAGGIPQEYVRGRERGRDAPITTTLTASTDHMLGRGGARATACVQLLCGDPQLWQLRTRTAGDVLEPAGSSPLFAFQLAHNYHGDDATRFEDLMRNVRAWAAMARSRTHWDTLYRSEYLAAPTTNDVGIWQAAPSSVRTLLRAPALWGALEQQLQIVRTNAAPDTRDNLTLWDIIHSREASAAFSRLVSSAIALEVASTSGRDSNAADVVYHGAAVRQARAELLGVRKSHDGTLHLPHVEEQLRRQAASASQRNAAKRRRPNGGGGGRYGFF